MPKKTIGNENYSLELDKVAGWNRQTVADGVWLNNNTIRPLDKNEEVLASAILYTSAGLDYTSAGLDFASAGIDFVSAGLQTASGILQSEIETMQGASDVVEVFANDAEFEYFKEHLPEWITDKDIIKILNDEEEDETQTYYRYDKPNDTWTYIGKLDPYYNKSEIDIMMSNVEDGLEGASAYVESAYNASHQELKTSADQLYSYLSNSASKLQNEVEWTSAWVNDMSGAISSSAAKLKEEIDFTSAWLDSAYAVNGSSYIDVTSGADVFGKQQTFTVGLKDEPYELDAADENVRIYEENNKTLVSAYPWNTFYAIPEVTEFDEIKTAYDKGHTILLKDENKIFVLDSETSTAPAGSFFFVSIGYDIIEKSVGPENVEAGVDVESWECFNSYGHTDWKHLIGYTGRKLLATTDYVDYISSATSGNAFAKSSAYTDSTSAELYSWMQGTSGKTDVSGSLFIKSSKTTKPDGTNTFTMELDTGKFLGENIRITSASNGMTFSAKNYDQAIKDTSANAVSVANAHADAASGFALNQAKTYARETSGFALDQAKAYARETSASALDQAKAYARETSASSLAQSKAYTDSKNYVPPYTTTDANSVLRVGALGTNMYWAGQTEFQSDWNSSDQSSLAYIKNKPTISTVEEVVQGPGGATYNQEKKLGIDQYTHAVSGSSNGTTYDTEFGYLAPALLTDKAGKVLKVKSTENGVEWADDITGGEVYVTSANTYNDVMDIIRADNSPVFSETGYTAGSSYSKFFRRIYSGGGIGGSTVSFGSITGDSIVIWTVNNSNVWSVVEYPVGHAIIVTTSTPYATVKNAVDAGYNVILRDDASSTLSQYFRLSQKNPDGSFYFSCVDNGSNYIISYTYHLQTNGTWTRTDMSITNQSHVQPHTHVTIGNITTSRTLTLENAKCYHLVVTDTTGGDVVITLDTTSTIEIHAIILLTGLMDCYSIKIRWRDECGTDRDIIYNISRDLDGNQYTYGLSVLGMRPSSNAHAIFRVSEYPCRIHHSDGSYRENGLAAISPD